MNIDLETNFKNFLSHHENYFITVEEQEKFQYYTQGVSDNIDNILKLIFNNIDSLTDKELKHYRKSLLQSITRGFDTSNENQQVNNLKDDLEAVTEHSRFNTFFKNYLSKSTQ